MLPLNLPKFDIKVTDRDGKKYIWDIVRRKYLCLTPEEWVRQHFVNFLVNHKGYPLSLIGNEVQISLNNTAKRCDTIVYDRFITPMVIVEYKAPHVSITKSVFDQILRYNMALHVKYLIVSNGIQHFCCKVNYQEMRYSFLTDIPEYNTLDTNLE